MPAEADGPDVVVLGASGYIGSAVLATVAARPGWIRAIARRPAAVPIAARADIEVRTADLTDRAALAEAVRGARAVVHLVADINHGTGRSWRVTDDGSGERLNLGPVRDLVDVLSGRAGPPATVVLTGSTTQVGPHDRLRIDGTEPDRPETAYDRQKLAAERLLLAAHRRGELRAVPLRLPTVFGASDAGGPFGAGVVAAMIGRALTGRPLTMWHDGSVVRDLLHVDDVAAAVGAVLARPEAVCGRPWLLGTGTGVPLRDVFVRIAALAAEVTGTLAVPVTAIEPPGHATPEDFRGVEVEAGAFRVATGWRPRIALDEGLRSALRRAR